MMFIFAEKFLREYFFREFFFFLRIHKIVKTRTRKNLVVILWTLLSEFITGIPQTKSFFGWKCSFNFHYYLVRQGEPYLPRCRSLPARIPAEFLQENSVIFPFLTKLVRLRWLPDIGLVLFFCAEKNLANIQLTHISKRK